MIHHVAVPGSKVECAPKELKAFRRISLQPGETKTARLEIPAADLAYYDEQAGWTVEAGPYTLIAAQHFLDPEARRAEFEVQ